MCAVCGHDGHMACLVGAVRVLSSRLDRLPRDAVVRLLFQPAEEGTARGGGAEPMVREGCMEGVSEVYGWRLADRRRRNPPVFALHSWCKAGLDLL